MFYLLAFAHTILVSKNMHSADCKISIPVLFSVFPIAYMYFVHLFGAGEVFE